MRRRAVGGDDDPRDPELRRELAALRQRVVDPGPDLLAAVLASVDRLAHAGRRRARRVAMAVAGAGGAAALVATGVRLRVRRVGAT